MTTQQPEALRQAAWLKKEGASCQRHYDLGVLIERQHAELETLRASHGQAPAQPDPAYSAACNLATALFKKHFAHLPDFASGQAVWSLCDSTAGVISQIDNMVSGLVQPPTTSPQADSVLEDAARYRWLAANCRSTSEHWGGRWSIIIDGPAPKSHDSEDDFDAAVDAARKQGATP